MEHRLLVVDDEEHILEMLVAYFARQGFAVDTANTLASAQTKLQETAYRVVILDIMLAGESGLQLLTELKRARPDSRVLMFTGLGYDADLMGQALDKGADGYITKGMPMEDLLIAVRRVLED